ncbi:unnamed protein product [Didymodactylos carnosus]|uniref:L-Fucosyltransferase n=1 Tax=Didymodactylos carnosus TaxID=1234261 RepID=A0A8S2E547_9BILA|nr:unnamed protein product [Didymodactylos carnosus]CAF3922943.1 unnamed protein product [Didymodactylos carnosus]
MFASAYGLARLHQCRLYVSSKILTELRRYFIMEPLNNLITDIAVSNLSGIQRMYSVCTFFSELMLPNAIKYLEIEGYWQAYGHFAKHNEELRQLFNGKQETIQRLSTFFSQSLQIIRRHYGCTPKENISFKFSTHEQIKKALMLTNFTWIGIHIRRTDFILNKQVSSDSYVLEGIKYFSRKYEKSIFIVASDDKLYCSNLLKNQVNVIVTPDLFSAIDDLISLGICQHSIVTGGSFGWWAAFLANGDVLHDVQYDSLRKGCNCTKEWYYPPWFLLPSKV